MVSTVHGEYLERQGVVGVEQHHDALLRRLEGQLPVRGAVEE
jgi:hypothetical protein